MKKKMPKRETHSDIDTRSGVWKKLKFTGRKIGAIGIVYPIELLVRADTDGIALVALREKYEHISDLDIRNHQ